MPAPKSPEFRRRAVELARLGEKPIVQIANVLGIAESGLRRWMKQATSTNRPDDRHNPRREPADQDRRPQPGRDRDVGVRHRQGGGLKTPAVETVTDLPGSRVVRSGSRQ